MCNMTPNNNYNYLSSTEIYSKFELICFFYNFAVFEVKHKLVNMVERLSAGDISHRRWCGPKD